MDRFALRFSRFFIRWRAVNLTIIGLLTVFFAYHAMQLQVFSQFIDLLPRNHSFIQVYEKYNRQFGSANVVVAAIVAKDGTIYDETFLEKIYAFTDQIDKVEGDDHGQVVSMTAVTVRDQASTSRARSARRRWWARSRSRCSRRSSSPGARCSARGEARRAVPSDLRGVRGLAKQSEGRARAAARCGLRALQAAGRRRGRGRQARGRARENAELEFMQLRPAELPPDYRLEGEKLRGPDGTLPEGDARRAARPHPPEQAGLRPARLAG
jgi:hypothetical protein